MPFSGVESGHFLSRLLAGQRRIRRSAGDRVGPFFPFRISDFGFPSVFGPSDFGFRHLFLVAAFLLCLLVPGQGAVPAPVVVYAAQDQDYAEPILRQFTQETGIRVRTLYDSEAVKTVGMAQRLLAERSHPQCDVFWGNEELRTRQLAARGVFRETNGWAAFGFRSRRLVVNTNKLALSAVSGISLFALTNSEWRRKIALAYPLFGTTCTHFLALRQFWGPDRWTAWCRALQANEPFLVDGNSVVVKFVGRGEAVLGLTDSDDILAGQREGLPIAAIPLAPEMLLIPNTVAVTRGAPHPDSAEQLFQYLQRPAVLTQLVKAGALEGSSGSSPSPHATRGERAGERGGHFSSSKGESLSGDALSSESTLHPDWAALLRDLEPATQRLGEVFLR